MNRKCKIIDLDDLTDICGYFESETGVNNFYGCKHPDCEESEEYEPGKWMGKCYSFSCPVADEADLDDLEKYDTYLFNEWNGYGENPIDFGANLMVVCDEKLLKKLEVDRAVRQAGKQIKKNVK